MRRTLSLDKTVCNCAHTVADASLCRLNHRVEWVVLVKLYALLKQEVFLHDQVRVEALCTITQGFCNFIQPDYLSLVSKAAHTEHHADFEWWNRLDYNFFHEFEKCQLVLNFFPLVDFASTQLLTYLDHKLFKWLRDNDENFVDNFFKQFFASFSLKKGIKQEFFIIIKFTFALDVLLFINGQEGDSKIEK